jgi:ribosome-binding protein aMBF1 (putative translation factor)
MTTIHIPSCWICGRAVSLGDSKIDENHLAVHESCYVAKVALEKGQSQPSTVAKEVPSQPSTLQKPST